MVEDEYYRKLKAYHEQPVRKASCADCFYNGVCPGLIPSKGKNDTDAERCKAYIDNREGRLICACCKSCRLAKREDGKHRCTKQEKSGVICGGWHDPKHFTKGDE